MNLTEERAQSWRADLRSAIKAKDRTAQPRVHMPELDADYQKPVRRY